MTTNREERIEMIKEYARMNDLSTYDAAYDLVCADYEAAGFSREQILAELAPLNEAELVDLICNL